MDAGIRELLDLVLRWVHVIAGIMWIGNSLLWNWIDRNLEPSKQGKPGIQGEIWLLHSGAFYHVEKTTLEGRPMPSPVHWFKWQAYTTWLSGASLLVVVYYLSGGALLLDPAVSDIGPGAAAAVGVGVLVGAWLAYEVLWTYVLPRWPAAVGAAVSFALVVGLGYGLTRVFSGRAALLHVGAVLGTLMAGNVFRKIVPAQRQQVAAAEAGEPPDAALAARAKLRSIHNNYMTFPVIALMLISHFPGIYGHPLNWLLLAVILLAGAGVRHLLNVRFTYRAWKPALAATMATAVAALYLIAARPGATGATPAGRAPVAAGAVTFDRAHAVILKRCAVCHSASPADRTFGPAPAGVMFDTPEQIRARADRILERAVVSRTMPPANKTFITDEEREVLRGWIEGGARVP